ncbi:MAG: M23 family metallopeptidase [bacterium]
MRKIIKILVEVSLFLAKTIIFFKKLIVGFFNIIIKKPAFILLYSLYHGLIIPIYCLYLFISKKLGLKKSKDRKISIFLSNKRLIYIIIVFLTIILVFSNLTTTRDAIASEEVVGKTILGKLVSGEFTHLNELIEEYQGEGIMRPAQTRYLDRYAYLEPQRNIATNVKLDVLDIEPGSIDITVPISEVGIATTKTVQPRTSVIEYVVQSGDTVSTIAQSFGITVNTILWENNLTAYSYIKPGQKLAILPSSGVRHKVKSGDSIIALARKYDIEQEEIMKANGITNPNQLKIGHDLIIPGGTKPRVVAASVRTPIFTGSEESAKPVYGSKMNWPTQGHKITQYYSWRHSGLDIANKIGTPIYAADAGTVEVAVWNRHGYGNNIVIDHGGGKKTRYAHLSSFGVKVGDTVDKGQYIGGMGSTGLSTGSHLHFEVIIDGKKYNPLNYIEY